MPQLSEINTSYARLVKHLKINHCNLRSIYKEPASVLCTFYIGSPICTATSHSRHHISCAEKQTEVPKAPCLEPPADGCLTA